VKLLVERIWRGEERDFERSALQLFLHVAEAERRYADIDIFVVAGIAREEIRDKRRPDRAHCANLQDRLAESCKLARCRLCGDRLLVERPEIGRVHPPKLGTMRIALFEVDERSAKLVLERLDGARQGGLADVALFSCE